MVSSEPVKISSQHIIKLASPDLREVDFQRALEVLRSGDLVQGSQVAAFESRLTSFTKIDYASVVSSGTAALHVALMALDIGLGDAVLAPAFTFPATTNVIECSGASTVLCDVDPKSYVMTPEAVREAILTHQGPSLKAIMVVHEFGYPVDVLEIRKIADEYGLFVIEDAACALGTVTHGHHVGYFSEVACFSFHPRKAITTGEGGAMITRNSNLHKRMLCLRNHGMERRQKGLNFIEAGLNYRMTDFQAALALGQLDRYSEELERRRQLAHLYNNRLQENPNISLPYIHDGHSLQSYMVVLDTTLDREAVINRLYELGVQTNLGAQAIHCLEYYQKRYGWQVKQYPNAARLYHHGLVLPLYGKLTTDQVEWISDILMNETA